MEVGDPTCGQAVFPIYGVLGTHRMRVSNEWGAVLSPLQTEPVLRRPQLRGGVLLFAVEGIRGGGRQPLETEAESAKEQIHSCCRW